ncbi:hypothetical protein BVRB_6g150300 [Beta vulgaris subsp. vulgaris]|nr:hypothetical protein BVRB_6g150300 [Beta vulgaris subsp. vulgaris]
MVYTSFNIITRKKIVTHIVKTQPFFPLWNTSDIYPPQTLAICAASSRLAGGWLSARRSLSRRRACFHPLSSVRFSFSGLQVV